METLSGMEDSSVDWVTLKDLKQSNPIELSFQSNDSLHLRVLLFRCRFPLLDLIKPSTLAVALSSFLLSVTQSVLDSDELQSQLVTSYFQLLY